ncbi:TPA: hypothetical protein ACGPDF_000640 [Streptococcus suis]|jgi:hypothetical protein|uniref:hypothetical protein n=1 Tax=Streptococcus parasuis TaxID=1501662 RepID=UPI001C20106A|nr:hypothetical protein [Streptococcus parasuis]QWV86932.1 hypothetical protein KQ224_02060 [Streptococcus parasuis]
MEETELEKFVIEKTKKKTHKIVRTIGATSIAIGSAVVAAKAVPKLAAAINKASVKYSNHKSDEDDWGPEMVKKIDYEESERDENAD